MTNYTATEYTSESTLAAAIEAMDTTTTFDIVIYRDNNATKYCLVSPHPRVGA